MDIVATPIYNNISLMHTRATKYSIIGALIAGCAVVLATLGTGYFLTGKADLAGFVTAQKSNMALWILDLMPFVFAFWGQKVSAAITQNVNALVHSHTEELRQKTETLERRAMHDATHDPLTDLPNRMLLRDRLDQALLNASRSGTPAALLVLDIDRFKEINDALGHHNGDRLLKQIAIRMREVVFTTDTLARLGGDEFALVLSALQEKNDVYDVVHKIQRVFAAPFVINNMPLDVQASIGVALYPEHGLDAEDLLQRADIAMYVAKEDRRHVHIYDANTDQHNSKRLSLLAQLRQAIGNGEMRLYYQPKIHATTLEARSVEALVRWQHPEYGMVPPNEFIHLAEQSGLIADLTQWVLRTAVTQAGLWRRKNIDLGVAINLSPSTLLDPEFPDFMAGLLANQQLPKNTITLEITETTLVRDPDLALTILKQLAGLGVAISIDDFGTGYSSLAYLKKMPASELKIDQTFVMDMLTDDSDAAIVRATVDLAHNLGLKVVAEGVEYAETAQALCQLGCDTLQGFHFGRPMPADAFDDWLIEYKCQDEKVSSATG